MDGKRRRDRLQRRRLPEINPRREGKAAGRRPTRLEWRTSRLVRRLRLSASRLALGFAMVNFLASFSASPSPSRFSPLRSRSLGVLSRDSLLLLRLFSSFYPFFSPTRSRLPKQQQRGWYAYGTQDGKVGARKSSRRRPGILIPDRQQFGSRGSAGALSF